MKKLRDLEEEEFAMLFFGCVIVIGLSVWAGMHFSHEVSETSKENYKSAETYVELFPKIKHMLQDSMADNILTNSEYDRVEAAYHAGLKEEEHEESRASLLKVIYKKDQEDGPE